MIMRKKLPVTRRGRRRKVSAGSLECGFLSSSYVTSSLCRLLLLTVRAEMKASVKRIVKYLIQLGTQRGAACSSVRVGSNDGS